TSGTGPTRAVSPLSNPQAAPVNSTKSAPVVAATAAPSDGGKVSEKALRQIHALEEEKAARSPVQQKIDSQLLFARKMSRHEPIASGVPTLQVELDRDEAGRVLLDLKANVSADLLAEIGRRGGRVINSFAEYQAVRAALPLDEIENLSARPD